MTDTYTIYYEKIEQKDPRLGRNILHDSRSKNFAVEPVDDPTKLTSVHHERYIPILNQTIGSCTGNAAVGCLGTGQFWNDKEVQGVLTFDADHDEKYAVDVYSAATVLDPYPGSYPPTDTGSDGLSVAKVLQQRGLIVGYQHAFSLEAALTALSKQPVIVGTRWHYGMSEPQKDGRMLVTGTISGGHEYVLDQLDVENKRVWMTNSWNTDWGFGGRAYLTWDDFGTLLAEGGDCTVFVSNGHDVPTPKPPSPPADHPKYDFIKAAKKFDKALHKFMKS